MLRRSGATLCEHLGRIEKFSRPGNTIEFDRPSTTVIRIRALLFPGVMKQREIVAALTADNPASILAMLFAHRCDARGELSVAGMEVGEMRV